MPISAGTKLGSYEVVSKVGEGGMGEVYRAHDPSLGRSVAIKVLPSAFSSDADRLQRFQQEAQAAGSLNHPNILVIYHVGTENGAPYIVSELLEGETLREKIAGVPLPARKAVDYGLQIAYGLAAAHEKGIIHRDLKPENIFVTKDGRVKILDFGLAKLTQPTENELGTDLPTRKLQTDPGTIMGTIGYMSPEQVRAKPLDHRTDIFSFGVIFYEMLTGKMAFQGDSTADLMSAILREDPPPLSTTNSEVSPALERVIDHCLEKNAEERFHSARDLAFAVEALSGRTVVSGVSAVPDDLPRSRRWRRWVPWALAGGLFAATLGFAYLYFSTEAKQEQLRFTIAKPEKTDEILAPSISPDGRTIAFVGFQEGVRTIFVRPLDSITAQRLPGTEDGTFPFWSPDSRSLGFFSEGKLRRVDVGGGPVQTLCDAKDGAGGSWNRDGVILFARYDHGIHKVAAAGGSATEVVSIDKAGGEVDHAVPHFLPDGQHFLYHSWRGSPAAAELWVASLNGKVRKSLIKSNSNPTYADGYILFARDSTLMAQRFGLSSLALEGEPVPVAENVLFNNNYSLSNYSVSQNGVLIYVTGGGSLRHLKWYDRAGKVLGTVEPPGMYNDVQLSPDGRFLATQRLDGEKSDIWIFDLVRNVPSRFTLSGLGDDDPVWSADSKYLYFISRTSDGGPDKIVRKSATGAGATEVVADPGGKTVDDGIDLSRDGKFVILEIARPESLSDLWIIPTDGSERFPVANSNFGEFHGRFSPDGKWIAYVSSESGRPEVFVRSFPDDTGKWQVSTTGGGQPRWRSDGKELYYMDANKQLVALTVKNSRSSETESPVVLFRTAIGGYLMPNRFDVSPDGQKFIVNSTVEDNNPTPIVVTTNWTIGIKK